MAAGPASKKQRKTAEPAAAPPPMSWPAIAPPEDELEFNAILPEQLLTISPFLNPITLKAYRAFVNAPSFTSQLERTPPPKRGEALRINDRFSVRDPAFAEALWTQSGLQQLCNAPEDPLGLGKGKRAVGLNSNIRVYRYTAGSLFGKHYDDDTLCPDIPGSRSLFTLLIYLTGAEDGTKGGATIFYPPFDDRIRVETSKGMALLHRHGRDCMAHEGEKVEEGVKWILRSDVMVA